LSEEQFKDLDSAADASKKRDSTGL